MIWSVWRRKTSSNYILYTVVVLASTTVLLLLMSYNYTKVLIFVTALSNSVCISVGGQFEFAGGLYNFCVGSANPCVEVCWRQNRKHAILSSTCLETPWRWFWLWLWLEPELDEAKENRIWAHLEKGLNWIEFLEHST